MLFSHWWNKKFIFYLLFFWGPFTSCGGNPSFSLLEEFHISTSFILKSRLNNIVTPEVEHERIQKDWEIWSVPRFLFFHRIKVHFPNTAVPHTQMLNRAPPTSVIMHFFSPSASGLCHLHYFRSNQNNMSGTECVKITSSVSLNSLKQ